MNTVTELLTTEAPVAPEPAPLPPFVRYWRGLSESQQKTLRKACLAQGMHKAQFSMLVNGHRKAGARTMARLLAADRRITKEMLRPDLFGAKPR